MTQFALSSWSLHGMLGKQFFTQQNSQTILERGNANGQISLLELPALVAQNGIHILEICHFHFPSIEDAYLAQLKEALIENNVILENILIDAGNLSNPNDSERNADIEMAKLWQTISAKLGAKGNRIDCGTEPPTPSAIQHAANSLQLLTDHATTLGLQVVTENFRQTSVEAVKLIEIMAKVTPPLKLCVDFGNAEKTGDKFGTIEALMPYGTSIHCKANYHDGQIDLSDLHQSLSYLKRRDFDGPITLIFDKTEDEWAHIVQLREAVGAYLD